MAADINIIKILLPRIVVKTYELKAKSLAVPLLGTGNGKIPREEILNAGLK